MRITELWRFPVKSMQGERLDRAELTERGLTGDRSFAVIDGDTGKVASAKNPRKWGGLLECTARLEGDGVVITLPDGGSVHSGDGDVDQALSAVLGRTVTLASVPPDHAQFEEVWPDVDGLAPAEFIERTAGGRDDDGLPVSSLPIAMASPAGTFFDLAPLHLLTSATLSHLASLVPSSSFDVRRYRPNVLIDGADGGFTENGWTGSTVALGSTARANVTLPTMRCVMTTLAQPGLPRDPATLQGIARHNRVEITGLGTWACAGAYAGVAAIGPLAVGDAVSVV
jgi:uncharacterized protein YcbX